MPLADGGEGTLLVLQRALGGQRVPARVRGADGREVEAERQAGEEPVEGGQVVALCHRDIGFGRRYTFVEGFPLPLSPVAEEVDLLPRAT